MSSSRQGNRSAPAPEGYELAPSEPKCQGVPWADLPQESLSVGPISRLFGQTHNGREKICGATSINLGYNYKP